jgi:hypothetical protein
MTEKEFYDISNELGLTPKQDYWGLYAYYGPGEDDWIAHYDFNEGTGSVYGEISNYTKSAIVFKNKLTNRLKQMKLEQLQRKLCKIDEDF